MPFALAAVLLAFGSNGCGSDASGGAGSGDQGKKLSDLTPAEEQELCLSTFDDFQALSAGSCTLNGLDAPTKADCEMTRTECNQGAMQTGAMAACTPTDASPLPDFSECTSIRVSQVESCLTEARAYFSTLSCDAVGQTPPMAPSCLATLEQGCPALLSGTS
jgi:hypothetical protein